MAEIRTKKALAVIVVLNILRKKNRPPRQSKHKTREWMKKRVEKGLYVNLILELSAQDPLGFREIMQMGRDQFHEILGNFHLRHFGLLKGLGLETGPLTLIDLCNTTLLKGRLTRFNICCVLEKMFDRNQNILPTKNVEQTLSNMHATRSNIAYPTNVL